MPLPNLISDDNYDQSEAFAVTIERINFQVQDFSSGFKKTIALLKIKAHQFNICPTSKSAIQLLIQFLKLNHDPARPVGLYLWQSECFYFRQAICSRNT